MSRLSFDRNIPRALYDVAHDEKKVRQMSASGAYLQLLPSALEAVAALPEHDQVISPWFLPFRGDAASELSSGDRKTAARCALAESAEKRNGRLIESVCDSFSGRE